MPKDNIRSEADLLNLDYDDVLHLYRGWRAAETQVKDKTKEINALRERLAVQQQENSEFKDNLHTLEGLRDLKIKLETDLAFTEKENDQLKGDLRNVQESHNSLENIIKSKEALVEQQRGYIQNLEIEITSQKGMYAECVETIKVKNNLLEEEIARTKALRIDLSTTQDIVATLKRDNETLKGKLDTTTARMLQCDRNLAHASEQLRDLTVEVGGMAKEKFDLRDNVSQFEAEVNILQKDISRLLQLLEHYPSSKRFLNSWRASQGMTFVGAGRPRQQRTDERDYLDMDMHDEDDDFEAEDDHGMGWKDVNIDPDELADMKRYHGGIDKHPLPSNFDDELAMWVPRAAAQKGLAFLQSELPSTSPAIILDFLRSVNKVWLHRERRKIKLVKEFYEQIIVDLKRQIKNSQPYRGVIAENEVRWLKLQVKEERRKRLHGRAKHKLEVYSAMKDYDSEDEGVNDVDLTYLPSHQRELGKHIHELEGRRRSASAGKQRPDRVAMQKLLQASLHTLEKVGRGTRGPAGQNDDLEDPFRTPSGGAPKGALGGIEKQIHPSEQYLKGAWWLGRNMTLVTEELAQHMDTLRSRYLAELASAVQEADSRRGLHRLSSLATLGINQALDLVHESRVRARNIFKGASSLTPGNLKSLKKFLHSLPLEANLLDTDFDKDARGPYHNLNASNVYPPSPKINLHVHADMHGSDLASTHSAMVRDAQSGGNVRGSFSKHIKDATTSFTTTFHGSP